MHRQNKSIIVERRRTKERYKIFEIRNSETCSSFFILPDKYVQRLTGTKG